jgi:hypothetical protein
MWYKIISTAVCVAAMSPVAWAGVLSTSGSNLPATTTKSLLLASTSVSATTMSETGDQLADAILSSEDVPRTSLLVTANEHPDLRPIEGFSQQTRTIKQRIAEIQSQRAGFSLDGLFRGNGDSSLGSMFVGMAFIGPVVGGIRLEILRRRAEKSAFYGAVLAKHRPRSMVIYVETPQTTGSRNASSTASSTASHGGRRRRRRRSSHSEHGHSSTRRHQRSYEPTHPVTVEGRLAG